MASSWLECATEVMLHSCPSYYRPVFHLCVHDAMAGIMVGELCLPTLLTSAFRFLLPSALSIHQSGVMVTASGYSHKLRVLVDIILEKIAGFQVTPATL